MDCWGWCASRVHPADIPVYHEETSLIYCFTIILYLLCTEFLQMKTRKQLLVLAIFVLVFCISCVDNFDVLSGRAAI
jgi:hypothetical protein